MSYDRPLYITYSFAAIDYGDGTKTRAIKGPSGMRGRVEDIVVSVTETFNQVTTTGRTQVGKSGTLDAYADMPMGVSASGAAAVASATAGSTLKTVIPADTAVLLTCVAPTGGSPAGIGDVHVVMAWY